jgi:hypothetical protein
LATKAIQLDEVDSVIDILGLRFAGTRALSELLAGAAAVHPPYSERVRAAHSQVLKLAEEAMTLSMGGDPVAAVKNLIHHGASTLSGKLIETAYLVLHRYAAKMTHEPQLAGLIADMRNRYNTHISRAALGEQKRQAGGLTLRAGSKSAKTSTPSSSAE